MTVSRELKKWLNPRILHLLMEDALPTHVTNVRVGWTRDRAYWAHKTRRGKWVLRSGRRFPKKATTPRELDVDLGYTSYSLSGIVPSHGTVGTMM